MLQVHPSIGHQQSTDHHISLTKANEFHNEWWPREFGWILDLVMSHVEVWWPLAGQGHWFPKLVFSMQNLCLERFGSQDGNVNNGNGGNLQRWRLWFGCFPTNCVSGPLVKFFLVFFPNTMTPRIDQLGEGKYRVDSLWYQFQRFVCTFVCGTSADRPKHCWVVESFIHHLQL